MRRVIIYQSQNYSPERVTGRYVRRQRKGLYRVYEAASGTGRWAGHPGRGPTLREWDTDGTDLPEHVRDLCDDESGRTQKWD